jgi:hypothetical protein
MHDLSQRLVGERCGARLRNYGGGPRANPMFLISFLPACQRTAHEQGKSAGKGDAGPDCLASHHFRLPLYQLS